MPLIDSVTLLIPTAADLGAWAGVFIATLALIGLGRLLSLGGAAPEAALVAGWGGASLVLTAWGVASAASLRLPAEALLALGLLALLLPRLRLTLQDWHGLLRIGVVALPLLAVMASARPSLPDTFLNLLPNAAYLYDHAQFPADDRWPSHSFLPAAPYNLQLAAFLASFFTRGFPPAAMIAFNIVLQLAFALLLACVVEHREDEESAVPSWTAAAFGLILATALNPGFVPRYDVSAYSEASVTVCLGFAGWFAACALERRALHQPAGTALALLALTLAALVNIKQESVAMAVGVVVAAGAVALMERRGARWGSLLALGIAAAPAALLYLAWRWYVLTHFAAGELKPLPFAEWQFANTPIILRSMAEVVVQKPYFFGLMALALIGLAWRLARYGLDRAARVTALLIGLALVYNLALFAAYIGHFPGEMSVEAHSYFRYNTHLGLLLMLALALLARDAVALRRYGLEDGRRVIAVALFGILLLSPAVFLRYLRFDLEEPQQRAWQVARLARQGLAQDERLALLLPGDNGSVAAMLDGLIRFTPPRHPDADLRTVAAMAPDTLDRLAAAGYGRVLFSCMPPHPGSTAPPQAALLEHGRSGWRVTAVLPFAPQPHGRWSHVLAEAPLCL